jgi:hypothetical protein
MSRLTLGSIAGFPASLSAPQIGQVLLVSLGAGAVAWTQKATLATLVSQAAGVFMLSTPVEVPEWVPPQTHLITKQLDEFVPLQLNLGIGNPFSHFSLPNRTPSSPLSAPQASPGTSGPSRGGNNTPNASLRVSHHLRELDRHAPSEIAMTVSASLRGATSDEAIQISPDTLLQVDQKSILDNPGISINPAEFFNRTPARNLTPASGGTAGSPMSSPPPMSPTPPPGGGLPSGTGGSSSSGTPEFSSAKDGVSASPLLGGGNSQKDPLDPSDSPLPRVAPSGPGEAPPSQPSTSPGSAPPPKPTEPAPSGPPGRTPPARPAENSTGKPNTETFEEFKSLEKIISAVKIAGYIGVSHFLPGPCRQSLKLPNDMEEYGKFKNDPSFISAYGKLKNKSIDEERFIIFLKALQKMGSLKSKNTSDLFNLFPNLPLWERKRLEDTAKFLETFRGVGPLRDEDIGNTLEFLNPHRLSARERRWQERRSAGQPALPLIRSRRPGTDPLDRRDHL